MQNDFSIINRRVEENGVTEASSPVHENVGFMAYNVLAGGVLTGKYLEVAAAVDNAQDPALAEKLLGDPRGRMDDYSWAGAFTTNYYNIRLLFIYSLGFVSLEIHT